MTREEFFRWAEAQDEGYEFDGERPIPMPPGNARRGHTVVNLIATLHTRLRRTPCRVLPSSGAGVATTGGRIRYPAATITCSPARGADRLIPNPVVVFEIVDPATARIDRLEKMREYQAVPSIRRTVLIEQSSPVVVSYAREREEPWTAISLSLDDTLALSEIDIEIPVADIYDGITFDPA